MFDNCDVMFVKNGRGGSGDGNKTTMKASFVHLCFYYVKNFIYIGFIKEVGLLRNDAKRFTIARINPRPS